MPTNVDTKIPQKNVRKIVLGTTLLVENDWERRNIEKERERKKRLINSERIDDKGLKKLNHFFIVQPTQMFSLL